VDVPLASSFWLSTKPGKEAYVEPMIKGDGYRFMVKVGKPKDAHAAKNGTKLARGANFRCLLSNVPIASAHIYSEANAGGMGARLMAVVAEGDGGRVYLSPSGDMEETARNAQPAWKPDLAMPDNPRWFSPPLYGLRTFGDLFTSRQLVALTTFSDLVQEARARVMSDGVAASLAGDRISLDDGGTGATAYADAVAAYLALGVDRLADRSSTICGWDSGFTKIRNTFGRQAIQMTWDFAEGNPFSHSTGNFSALLEWVTKFLVEAPASPRGHSLQQDASVQSISADKVLSTDPPYYDNIGYADLSDFSTCGCAVRSNRYSQTSSQRWPCRRPRS
jgi:putative DNA methylase